MATRHENPHDEFSSLCFKRTMLVKEPLLRLKLHV